ncbi:hypothetical protein J6590_025977 [Homalodisca vitripennis]|nr:hypothetical protein J6590_025977 [Homalodisca vitripennis]
MLGARITGSGHSQSCAARRSCGAADERSGIFTLERVLPHSPYRGSGSGLHSTGVSVTSSAVDATLAVTTNTGSRWPALARSRHRPCDNRTRFAKS